MFFILVCWRCVLFSVAVLLSIFFVAVGFLSFCDPFNYVVLVVVLDLKFVLFLNSFDPFGQIQIQMFLFLNLYLDYVVLNSYIPVLVHEKIFFFFFF